MLGLPGIEVEDYQDQGEYLILEVEADRDRATCPQCGYESNHLHQNHGYLVRDLPISERPVKLKVNRRQFKCAPCSKPFSEVLEFVGRRRTYTDRFAQSIVQQVLHSDSHNVAVNHGLSDEEVWSMVEYISKKNPD